MLSVGAAFALAELRCGQTAACEALCRESMDLPGCHAEMHAANECMKIYGSYGFSTEFPAERFYRDAKSLQVVEGTSNIQKIIISGMATGATPNRE